MLLQRASSSSLLQILCFVSILRNVVTVEASVFCSREVYGFPKYSDCQTALLGLPNQDVLHYFVEQQLRTGPPRYDWYSIHDPRPFRYRNKVVQVPKMWSDGRCSRSAWRRPIANEYQGECNIALLSYVRRGTRISVSATEWSKIVAAGLQTLLTCLSSHNQGGAAVVNGQLPFIPLFRIVCVTHNRVFSKANKTSQRFQFLCGRRERHLTR